MQESEIIWLWKKGLSKNKLALMYKREHNRQIGVIRSSVRHRHDGRMISFYEALEVMERAIYRFVKEQNK